MEQINNEIYEKYEWFKDGGYIMVIIIIIILVYLFNLRKSEKKKNKFCNNPILLMMLLTVMLYYKTDNIKLSATIGVVVILIFRYLLRKNNYINKNLESINERS
jgi:uncharacterized membrane protein YfhO